MYCNLSTNALGRSLASQWDLIRWKIHFCIPVQENFESAWWLRHSSKTLYIISILVCWDMSGQKMHHNVLIVSVCSPVNVFMLKLLLFTLPACVKYLEHYCVWNFLSGWTSGKSCVSGKSLGAPIKGEQACHSSSLSLLSASSSSHSLLRRNSGLFCFSAETMALTQKTCALLLVVIVAVCIQLFAGECNNKKTFSNG